MTNPVSDDTLNAWVEAEKQAQYWTTREKELRNEIFAASFPDPKRGTNKIRVGHGLALVADYRINYTVDRGVLDQLRQDDTAAELIARVINYRPEVRGGEWEKFTLDEKRVLAAMITEKPGTPGLEIKSAAKLRW